MTDIIKLSVVLTIVSLAAGLAIAFTNSYTAAEIEKRKDEARTEALKTVFPEGVEITERKGDPPLPEIFWSAAKEGKTAGYAFQDSLRGYAKEIKIMVGVDTAGTVIGMKVLSQSETPGLGTRVMESVSKKYLWNGLLGKKESIEPWFTKQFVGLTLKNRIAIDKSSPEWHLVSEQEKIRLTEENKITAITGATISTRTVAKAVMKSIPIYVELLKDTVKPHD